MHEGDALLEYFPGSQFSHSLLEVAPVVALAFPASHARQTSTEVADRAGLRFIEVRFIATSSSLLSLRYDKTHLYLPASQSVQELVPTELLNFPDGQASHASAWNLHVTPTSSWCLGLQSVDFQFGLFGS